MQLKKLLIRVSKILALTIAIVYPFAVFFALRSGLSIRMIGLMLVCVALVSVAKRKSLFLGVCGILLAILTLVSESEIFLKLYPVFMNLGVCAMFAVSLKNKPLAQLVAEKQHIAMTEKSKNYARKVTMVWVVFMGLNTIISFMTVFMSDWIWTLYNGLISYCLIGIVMAVEYITRLRIFREHPNR